jgi:hypothetical protein
MNLRIISLCFNALRLISVSMTLAVREFLAKKSILKLDHPPDLAPCDFWSFPKLKTALKGRHRRHSGTILKSIPEEEFQKCFEQWKHRLTKCIGAQGDYFEDDSNHQCVSNYIQLLRGQSGNLTVTPRMSIRKRIETLIQKQGSGFSYKIKLC